LLIKNTLALFKIPVIKLARRIVGGRMLAFTRCCTAPSNYEDWKAQRKKNGFPVSV